MSKIFAVQYGQLKGEENSRLLKYEIWHDGQCLIDRTGIDDTEYESEEEALEAATEEAEDKIQEWKDDECWDGETLEDFDIRIKEM